MGTEQTESTAEQTPNSTSELGTDDFLGRALSALKEDEQEQPSEASPEVAEQADAEPSEEEKPDDEKKEEWTPERIAQERETLTKERADIEAQRKKLNRDFVAYRKRTEKLAPQAQRVRAAQEAVTKDRADLDETVKRLTSGDTRTVLHALTRLTGMDGVELYRAMGETLASDGKSKPEKPKVDEETNKRLEQLEQERQARQAAAHNEQVLRGVYTELSGELAKLQDATHPLLKAEVERAGVEDVARNLLGEMLRRRQAGRVLDIDEICVLAENHLRSRRSGSETAPSQAKTDAGPPGGNEPKAERKPGASVSPSATTRPTSKTRPLTDEEREQEALRLVRQLFQ